MCNHGYNGGSTMSTTATPVAATTPAAPDRPTNRRDRLTVLLWLAVVIGGVLAGGAVVDRQANATVDAVRHEFDRLPAGRALVGGYPILDRELGVRAKADLARAEAVALPVVLILLGLAVRGAVGALLGLALVGTTVTGG